MSLPHPARSSIHHFTRGLFKTNKKTEHRTTQNEHLEIQKIDQLVGFFAEVSSPPPHLFLISRFPYFCIFLANREKAPKVDMYGLLMRSVWKRNFQSRENLFQKSSPSSPPSIIEWSKGRTTRYLLFSFIKKFKNSLDTAGRLCRLKILTIPPLPA